MEAGGGEEDVFEGVGLDGDDQGEEGEEDEGVENGEGGSRICKR